jgi:hypothetical protein
MKMLFRAALPLLAFSLCAPAFADVVILPQVKNAGGLNVPSQGAVIINQDGSAVGPGNNPLADANNAPFLGEIAMTVGGSAIAAGRSLKANCTSTGNVSVTYSDSSTGTWIVAATGTTVWPIAVTAVNSSGAACTFANMK